MPAALIGRLLPAGVIVAEVVGEPTGGDLFPVEEQAVARAVGSRRTEFATGRACARRALAGLGLRPVAVPVGPHREPIWPDGVIGSITHCAGYCAAVAAPTGDLVAVGIDAEEDTPLDDGVLAEVAGDAERDALGRLPAADTLDRVLFSAKESIYKAWYPLTGRWLGFRDVHVEIEPGAGTWTARLLVEGPVRAVRGRFAVAGGLVLTAVTVPAADVVPPR